MALWGSRQSDLQARIDDIQHGLSALAGLVGDRAGDAGRSAGPVLNDLKSQFDGIVSAASGIAGRAGREGRHAYRAVETKVEDNAMMAVVAAAGVGFLIGSLLVGGGAKRAVAALTPETEEPPQRQPRRAAARSRTRTTRGRGRRAA